MQALTKTKLPKEVSKLFSVLRCEALSRIETFQSAHLFSLLSSYNNTGQLDNDMQKTISQVLLKRASAMDKSSQVLLQPIPSHLFSQTDPSQPFILKDFGDVCMVYKPPFMQVNVDGDLSLDRRAEPDSLDELPESSLPSLKTWATTNLTSDPISRDKSHAHGILHRLDTLTSGPLLIARNFRGFFTLRIEFATGQIRKDYKALCHGAVPAPLTLSDRLKQTTIYSEAGEAVATRTEVSPQGKPALTQVNSVERYERNGKRYSLASMTLHTGRTHQIRAHLSNAGFPLVGDAKYNSSNILDDREIFLRTFLHCEKLGFSKGEVICPIPEDISKPLSIHFLGVYREFVLISMDAPRASSYALLSLPDIQWFEMQ